MQQVGYLQSWDPKMGRARLSCEAGCSCEPMKLNGWHKTSTSILTVDHFLVTTVANPQPSMPSSEDLEILGSQRPTEPCECTVKLVVLPHSLPVKFKVSMMMLSDNGDLTWADPWKKQWLSIGARPEQAGEDIQ